ncbi:MAG: 50S ribosomal protein L13 [Candidatus Aenigmarchaeota archaeon]|nr:50S ribosomal protein L13 [Candidatus Aenigmarchaeota archaeon]
MMILDGKNAVLGRLSSAAAKSLIKGEEVAILNAEKIIITGPRKAIKGKYLERAQRGSKYSGPYFYRSPERLVRRTIRGMMPYKTNKGRAAMKNLSIHVGMPEEYKSKEAVKMEKNIKSSFLYMEEVAKAVGWRG